MTQINRKTTNISINSKVTVNVYLPKEVYSREQDIQAEIPFNFGGSRSEFNLKLDLELYKLKQRILITCGMEKLPEDLAATVEEIV